MGKQTLLGSDVVRIIKIVHRFFDKVGCFFLCGCVFGRETSVRALTVRDVTAMGSVLANFESSEPAPIATRAFIFRRIVYQFAPTGKVERRSEDQAFFFS